MLTIKNLSVSVEGKKILKNINFTFEAGKTYAVMGPNGSGKSTLASVVMGNPIYSLSAGSVIKYQNKKINDLLADERAKKGIFLTFQTPLALSGVTIYQLMRYALNGTMDPLAIRQGVQKYAKKLGVPEEMLSRSLNEGFSGGERKKMEMIQAGMMAPQLVFFDEIDTGVDIDALRKIATFIKKMKTQDNTFVLITHYNRILKYMKPDVVIVLVDGHIVKVGDAKLGERVEKEGYAKFKL